MAESRVAIPGSDKRPVAQAEHVGDIHPDERIEVTVYLRARAQQELEQRVSGLASRSPSEREHLDRETFAQSYGADPADIARVEAFARANHLAVVSASAARRSVVLAGTAAQMTAAFGVSLGAFAHPDGGTFRGRQGPIYVPADLAGIVQGLFGLDDRPAAYPHIRFLAELEGIQPRAAAPRASFTPPQIATMYDYPTDVKGQGQTVAIIELGGGY